MQHEMEVAIAAGRLGSIDANVGDEFLGWDTDQFLKNRQTTTEIMLGIMKMGGFTTGGLNFDAKVRRASFMPIDLFYAHIGSMDAFARGLKAASLIRKDGRIDGFLRERYSSWDSGFGGRVEASLVKMGLKDCEAHILRNGGNAKHNESGRQECLENIFADSLDSRLIR
jgi:xylose isomerase